MDKSNVRESSLEKAQKEYKRKMGTRVEPETKKAQPDPSPKPDLADHGPENKKGQDAVNQQTRDVGAEQSRGNARKSELENAQSDYEKKNKTRPKPEEKKPPQVGQTGTQSPSQTQPDYDIDVVNRDGSGVGSRVEDALLKDRETAGNARKSKLELAEEEHDRKMHSHKNEEKNEDPKDTMDSIVASIMSNRSREHSNATAKILAHGEKKLQNLKEYAYTETTQGTDFGRGMKEYRENVEPFLGIVGDASRAAMAASMRVSLEKNKGVQEAYKTLSQMTDEKGKYLFRISELKNLSKNDIRAINQDALKVFHKMGITKLSAADLRDPVKVNLLIKKAVLTGRITEDEAKALVKVAKATTKIDGVLGGKWNAGKQKFVGKHRFRKFTMRKTKKYMRQDATGNAIIWYGKLTKAAVSAIRFQLKVAGVAFRAARFAAKTAAKVAIKAAIKLAKTKLGQKIVPLSTQNKIQKNVKSVKKASDKVKNSVGDAADKMKNALKPNKRGRDAANSKNPFTRMKYQIKQRLKRVTGVIFRGKYNPLRWIATGLGSLFSVTQQAKRVIVGLLAGFMIFYGLAMIIMLVITGILNGFSFDSREEALKDSIFTTIEECYSEQLTAIQNASSGNTTIEVVDKKTNAAYQDEENFDYTETTNITELISMTIVYFEGDLESQPTSTVTKYLKEMYYGSHDIVASTNDSGDTVVTVTTYYFDDLFNCPRKSSFGGMGLTPDGAVLNGQSIRVHFTTYQASPSQGGTNDAYGRPLNPDDHTVAVPNDGDDVGLKLGTQIQIVSMEGTDKYNNTTWTIRDHGAGWWSSTNSHGYHNTRQLGDVPNIDILTASPEGISCYGTIIIGDGTGYATETPVSDANLPATATQHLQNLQTISNFVKSNASHFGYNSGVGCSSFAKAQTKVSHNVTVSINCVVPTMWSLETMGLIDGSFYYRDGWHGYTSRVSAKMKKVNAANGMTVEKAAEQNLLQPGDIIGFKIDGHPSAGHTVTYVGKNSNGVPLCYDGGGVAKSLGYGTVGVGPVKYNNKNYYKIASILRWK